MEFELIDRIRRRARTRDDVLLGIGDDAALLQAPAGHDLVVTMDTLNSGIHFPPETRAEDLGWKALAVNLSDLAAMGADPAWCMLSLTLPEADSAWLDAFLDGFHALAARHDVALVGGDTTRGPLSISIAAHGRVPHALALRRDGARDGDDIWVTGTLGDAAAALRQWRTGGLVDATLRARLDRPTPCVAAGRALRTLASACIDISDGLVADLQHILRASAVGAVIEARHLPQSDAFRRSADAATRLALQLGGGDDYELCFTAPIAQRDAIEANLARAGNQVTRIGRIETGAGLRVLDAQGLALAIPARGWDHFGAAPT